uniref:DnaJ heat shock protein family (Hsp40) member C16 n=1 Tax=Callorhinchus milii TaxID=7868 RepID=A0A4W3HGP6_CALMI|eukprot:gi/632977580/ref/XP_007905427.1/ PREDICTED: dnaJ homolog subfamily C member 16 [Callorhinchus milii]
MAGLWQLYFGRFPVALAIVLLLNSPLHQAIEFDPYKVLGVNRATTQGDIKKAYKRLAREWHPDKNRDPKAEDRFIQIGKAYQILSNEEKRQNFDRYGEAESQHTFAPHHFRGFHNYESFFFDDPFHFQFNSGHDSFDDKYLLHFSQYMNEILPDSYRKPYLIKVTSDWCFSCIHIEPVWREVVLELEPLGVGIGVIDSGYERRLLQHLGVYQHPTILGIISGRVRFFKNAVVWENLRQFLENLLPTNLIEQVTVTNSANFLSAWQQDNKPRVLTFHQRTAELLMYKLAAFTYKDYVAFGSVDTKVQKSEELLNQYSINMDIPTWLIFKEKVTKPIYLIQNKNMKRHIIDEILSKNKFLLVPRLTSQKLLEELCLVRENRRQRRYCVLLITGEGEGFRASYNSFVSFASVNAEESLRFVYVYREWQQAFSDALLQMAPKLTAASQVVIFEQRNTPGKVFYTVLEDGWTGSEEDEEQLFDRLNHLLAEGDYKLLPHQAVLAELNEEFASIFLVRWLHVLIDYASHFWESGFNQNWREMMPLISLLFSVIFILFGAFIIQTFSEPSEQERSPGAEKQEPAAAKAQEEPKKQRSNSAGTPRSLEKNYVEVTELTYVNYTSNLVRLMPGHINVLVVVTDTTKDALLQKFAHEVYAVTWNKALHFSFLNLTKHGRWLENVLEFAQDPSPISNVPDESSPNQDYAGYVLALNGHRKYFCLFKPQDSSRKEGCPAANSPGSDPQGSAAAPAAGDESGGQQSPTHPTLSVKQTHQLLNRLNLWMDRFLEGILQRYYVPLWPDLD